MNLKIYKYLAIGACALAFSTGKVNAQVQTDYLHCGNYDAMKELFRLHPELEAQNQELLENSRANLSQYRLSDPVSSQSGGPPSFIVPIVFHILYSDGGNANHTYGVENISDAQVQDEVNILNRDYRLGNSDTANVTAPFKAVYADTKIEFRLATIDPDGNCTNGIDRIFSPHLAVEGDDQSKLNDWPRNKYLNVWVVKTIGAAGVAGYAYFPSGVTGIGFTVDGVIILHDYIGSIGTGAAFTSRALTHEIGHYLSLEHCWGNNNSPTIACGDDGIGDTPITKGWLTCPTLASSAVCSNQAIAPTCSFDSVTTFSGVTIGNTLSQNTGVNISAFTAVGLSSNPTDSDRFVFSGWGTGSTDHDTDYTNLTGSLNPANYYEVTVWPTSPYWMTLSTIDFNVQRDSVGPRSFAIRSSIDNYASNIPVSLSFANPNLSIRGGLQDEYFFLNDTAVNQSGCEIILTNPLFTARPVPVTFRIYAWNAETTGGDWGIDDFSINGQSGIYENVQNYMEYSYCSVMFTHDQVTAQHQTLTSSVSYRNNLPTYANHMSTGTDSVRLSTATHPYLFPTVLPFLPVCAPVANFSANRFYICQGGTVTFTDASWRAPITGRTWSFPNGTPSTSTVAAPTVTFNTWGWQDITMIATSTGGSDTLLRHNYVFVAPPWYDHFGPFTDSFENNDFDNGLWIVENQEDSYPKWEHTNTAHATGSKCIVLKAFGTERNLIDAFISPAYDLSTCSGATLNFKYCCASAMATFTAVASEEFKVYVSTNCGQSWASRGTMMNGPTLANAGFCPTSFTPNSSSPWTTRSIVLQPGDLVGGKTRFRFEYSSGYYSNNMYIDDINVSATNGIAELNNYNFDMNVYPNPAHGDNLINIAYYLHSTEKIKISLVDMLGRETVVVDNSTEQAGDKVVTIDKNALNLNSGIYMVKISNGSSYSTSKLVIAD